jgi:hypothetical protein
MTLIRRCARPIKLFGITEIEGGFPHSEIRGSKVVRTSPRLIAAYHVLHRLSAPRHPPNTLKALDRSHYQHPPSCAYPSPKSLTTFRGYAVSAEVIQLAPYAGAIERPFASNTSENIAVKQMLTTGSSSSRTHVKSDPLARMRKNQTSAR